MSDKLKEKSSGRGALAPLRHRIMERLESSSYKVIMDRGGLKTEVVENCSPQEVYDYEFLNHECGWTGDDEEAIQIVLHYFGADRAREVKRACIL